jgi:hypothetical protein
MIIKRYIAYQDHSNHQTSDPLDGSCLASTQDQRNDACSVGIKQTAAKRALTGQYRSKTGIAVCMCFQLPAASKRLRGREEEKTLSMQVEAQTGFSCYQASTRHDTVTHIG